MRRCLLISTAVLCALAVAAATVSNAAAGPTAGSIIDEARTAWRNGDPARAETLYKTALVHAPNNVPAMLELAHLYETTGKLEYARGLLTRASIVTPDNADIIERLDRVVAALTKKLAAEVDSLLAARAYEAAIPRLSVLLTANPENADYYFKRAECHLRLDRPSVALEDVRRALDLKKDDSFLALKRRAEDIMESREVDRLRREAGNMLDDAAPGSRDAVLERVGRILEVDPANEWARRTFTSLTENIPDNELPLTLWDRLRDLAKSVRQWAGPAGRTALQWVYALSEHLMLLTTILIALLVLNSPLSRALAGRLPSRHTLAGQIHPFGVTDILMLINNHAVTGVLRLSAGDHRGRVYFERGEVYHCKVGGLTGMKALNQLLTSGDHGSFVFQRGSRANDRTIDTPLTLILMELPERRMTAQQTLQQQHLKHSRMRSLLGQEK